MNKEEQILYSVKEVDTSSLVDKVENQLIGLFVEKGLTVGDMIPKEMELATAMGVSRTVIRESLTRLKTIGLIESKKHKGTIISSPNIIDIMQKSMIPKILDKKMLRDMFELRLVIEIGMADLIFINKTNDDISELEHIIKHEPTDSSNTLFSIEHEITFHSKLYEMTKNNTLKEFQNILLPIFNYVYDSGLLKIQKSKPKYFSHRQLVDIIKTGTPEEFRKGMRLHLHNHFIILND